MFSKLLTRARRLRPSRAAIRKGNIVVLAGFLMTATAGMLAFSIDSGYMLVVKSQLQAAADSAAMAGASVMGSTQLDPVATAKTYAAYHKAGGVPVTLQTSDIEYGTWDIAGQTFTKTNIGEQCDPRDRAAQQQHGRQQPVLRPDFRREHVQRNRPGHCDGQSARHLLRGGPVGLDERRHIDRLRLQCVVPQLGLHQHLFVDDANGVLEFEFRQLSRHDAENRATAGLERDLERLGIQRNLFHERTVVEELDFQHLPHLEHAIRQALRQTKAKKWIIDNQIASIMPNAKPAPSSSNTPSYELLVRLH